jgi:signal transduction histidine kinase
VSFRIRPPVWRQGWFLSLVLLTLGGAGIAYGRARVRRAAASERIRRGIAMDLHDDLGSGLAQVALLSELARRGPLEPDRADALERIGALARRLRASMGDLVRAIDPQKERLTDLVARVREVATTTLEPHGVTVRVTVEPDATTSIVLPPDARRQLLLFCTEATTNIACHAGANLADFTFRAGRGTLGIRVADDGIGFDPGDVRPGRGLTTLRQRIEALGGRLEVSTAPGRGVTLEARIPLR